MAVWEADWSEAAAQREGRTRVTCGMFAKTLMETFWGHNQLLLNQLDSKTLKVFDAWGAKYFNVRWIDPQRKFLLPNEAADGKESQQKVL